MSEFLTEMVWHANRRFATLTPEEQKKHWAEQRKSWVRGEMKLGTD